MSNLDNLVSTILKDSEEKSKLILAEAKEKAEAIARENVSIAEKEKEKIITDARLEADRLAERIELGKRLEIRNKHLKAKQEVIDKVFGRVLQKLNNMPKEEYLKFLKNALSAMDLDGEEIILPSPYNITDIDELNAFLQSKNKKGNLKPYSGKRDIDGGFILVKGGIENNNTFEAMVNFYRYELEGIVIENLF